MAWVGEDKEVDTRTARRRSESESGCVVVDAGKSTFFVSPTLRERRLYLADMLRIWYGAAVGAASDAVLKEACVRGR